jgi:hypothetical protein
MACKRAEQISWFDFPVRDHYHWSGVQSTPAGGVLTVCRQSQRREGLV